MAAPASPPPAPLPSAQFLREPELRRGMELLYFGHAHLTRTADAELDARGLGRAHHRALYFVARRPDITVSALLSLLSITKQSLGRVLNELTDRGLIEARPGERDRRQRLLRLTTAGAALESELFESIRQRMTAAYSRAGQQAVGGYWAVLEGMIDDEARAQIDSLHR